MNHFRPCFFWFLSLGVASFLPSPAPAENLRLDPGQDYALVVDGHPLALQGNIPLFTGPAPLTLMQWEHGICGLRWPGGWQLVFPFVPRRLAAAEEEQLVREICLSSHALRLSLPAVSRAGDFAYLLFSFPMTQGEDPRTGTLFLAVTRERKVYYLLPSDLMRTLSTLKAWSEYGRELGSQDFFYQTRRLLPPFPGETAQASAGGAGYFLSHTGITRLPGTASAFDSWYQQFLEAENDAPPGKLSQVFWSLDSQPSYLWVETPCPPGEVRPGYPELVTVAKSFSPGRPEEISLPASQALLLHPADFFQLAQVRIYEVRPDGHEGDAGTGILVTPDQVVLTHFHVVAAMSPENIFVTPGVSLPSQDHPSPPPRLHYRVKGVLPSFDLATLEPVDPAPASLPSVNLFLTRRPPVLSPLLLTQIAGETPVWFDLSSGRLPWIDLDWVQKPGPARTATILSFQPRSRPVENFSLWPLIRSEREFEFMIPTAGTFPPLLRAVMTLKQPSPSHPAPLRGGNSGSLVATSFPIGIAFKQVRVSPRELEEINQVADAAARLSRLREYEERLRQETEEAGFAIPLFQHLNVIRALVNYGKVPLNIQFEGFPMVYGADFTAVKLPEAYLDYLLGNASAGTELLRNISRDGEGEIPVDIGRDGDGEIPVDIGHQAARVVAAYQRPISPEAKQAIMALRAAEKPIYLLVDASGLSPAAAVGSLAVLPEGSDPSALSAGQCRLIKMVE